MIFLVFLSSVFLAILYIIHKFLIFPYLEARRYSKYGFKNCFFFIFGDFYNRSQDRKNHNEEFFSKISNKYNSIQSLR